MKRTAAVIVAIATLTIAAAPLHADAVTRDCGDLRVDPAQPRAGLSAEGDYGVIAFSRDDRVGAPACRSALRWSRAYARDGAVPKGFKVKAIRGGTGRAFLRIGNEDVGFRLSFRR